MEAQVAELATLLDEAAAALSSVHEERWAVHMRHQAALLRDADFAGVEELRRFLHGLQVINYPFDDLYHRMGGLQVALSRSLGRRFLEWLKHGVELLDRLRTS
jgi:hypothetical protein